MIDMMRIGTSVANVVHSILLYGTPVSTGRISKKDLVKLEKVQRRITLRVASAYRIVSIDAVQVILGFLPSLNISLGNRT
jgi:hypothetical protein